MPLDTEFPEGAWVITTQDSGAVGWTKEAVALRRWGVPGQVVGSSNRHGLIFRVRHTDGVVAPYEPTEIELARLDFGEFDLDARLRDLGDHVRQTQAAADQKSPEQTVTRLAQILGFGDDPIFRIKGGSPEHIALHLEILHGVSRVDTLALLESCKTGVSCLQERGIVVLPERSSLSLMAMLSGRWFLRLAAVGNAWDLCGTFRVSELRRVNT